MVGGSLNQWNNKNSMEQIKKAHFLRLLVIAAAFIVSLPSYSQGVGIEPSQLQPSGTKNTFLRATLGAVDEFGDSIWIYRHSVYDGGSGGGSGIDSVKCVSDSLRIYSGGVQYKTAIDCSKTNEKITSLIFNELTNVISIVENGVTYSDTINYNGQDSVWIKSQTIADGQDIYKIMFDHDGDVDSISITDKHPNVTVQTLTIGTEKTYNIKVDGATIASIVVDDISNTNEGLLTVESGGTNSAHIHSNTQGSVNIDIAGQEGIEVTENTSISKIYIKNTGDLDPNDDWKVTDLLAGDVAGPMSATQIQTGVVGDNELASTTVTAGSYTNANITVNQDGRITVASSGTLPGDITGVFVDDYLTGGGAVGAVTIGMDTTGTIGVGTKFDFSKLDLVPYVYMGDTIGAILENIDPSYNDTLLFDYGDLASNPYNLIPYVSGGDTIGAILTGLNSTSNDTLIFDSGDADFWQNVVLNADNTTTTTDYPFTFEPNDNTRYKIRVEALLYSSDPGVGVRPVFLIDGTLTGYSDYSVNIIAPNGENSNIVVYGGYNDPSWTANTTGSTGYTMTAIFDITLITTTNPADVKIGFASETGASVTMKKGSLFSYKTY